MQRWLRSRESGEKVSMETAVERWEAILNARAQQMDAAYARLGRVEEVPVGVHFLKEQRDERFVQTRPAVGERVVGIARKDNASDGRDQWIADQLRHSRSLDPRNEDIS